MNKHPSYSTVQCDYVRHNTPLLRKKKTIPKIVFFPYKTNSEKKKKMKHHWRWREYSIVIACPLTKRDPSEKENLYGPDWSNPVRDNRSAKIFADPGMGSTSKVNSCSDSAHRKIRPFLNSEVRRKVRGLWSVCRTKRTPQRKRRNFCTAHTIARHSRSMVL